MSHSRRNGILWVSRWTLPSIISLNPRLFVVWIKLTTYSPLSPSFNKCSLVKDFFSYSVVLVFIWPLFLLSYVYWFRQTGVHVLFSFSTSVSPSVPNLLLFRNFDIIIGHLYLLIITYQNSIYRQFFLTPYLNFSCFSPHLFNKSLDKDIKVHYILLLDLSYNHNC